MKDLIRAAEAVEEAKKVPASDHGKEAFCGIIRLHLLLAEVSHNLDFVMFVRAVMGWGRRKRAHWIPSVDEQL